MDTPKLVLDGKEYKAPKPKMRLLRKCMKFNSTGGRVETEEGYNMMLDLICEAFRNPEITPQTLDEKMDLDDLMPTVKAIVNWVGEKLGTQVAEIPNSPNPAG